MEMMVVLLIVAIIAAASAPMVTKKLSRSAGTNDSPWVFTGLNNNIAYNMNGNDNSTVIIGSTTTPADMQGSTRLYIDSGNNASHIAFGNGNTVPLLLTADPTRGRIGFSNQEIPYKSIAFGTGQSITTGQSLTGYSNIVAIGSSTTNNGRYSITLGSGATAQDRYSIAIGGYNEYSARNTEATGDTSIAIGSGAQATEHYSIALGGVAGTPPYRSTISSGRSAVAIGSEASAGGRNAIAIGNRATTTNNENLAIGRGAEASGLEATAIGCGARAITTSGQGALAIGGGSRATHGDSVAIGTLAATTSSNQIVLGRSNQTVYIPGNLVVGNNVILNRNGGHTSVHAYGQHDQVGVIADTGAQNRLAIRSANSINSPGFVSLVNQYSDRRLKNVGEKYTAGVAELKKLDFFHFTFKEDKEKTPHVGVMAQDLEKVFPDAVTKGEDGYLRIRWDDMFYAVINAVKELDNKIAEIVQKITDINSTIEKQNKTIEEQQKTIDKIQKTMEEQQKVIEKLEKQIKKLD